MARSKLRFEHPGKPAGGWGSVESIREMLWRQHSFLKTGHVILKQNKPDGFACVSCSWAKPAHPHTVGSFSSLK